MKNLVKSFLLISCFIVVSFSFNSCDLLNNNKLVKLSGEITNPTNDSVFFRTFYNTGNLILAQAKLDDAGKFSIEFEMEHAQPLKFYHGNESSTMFLEPGNEVLISLDAKEFDESLKYSGVGNENNNFLAAYFLKYNDFDTEGDFVDFYKESRDMDLAEYYKLVNDSYAIRNEYLKEISAVKKLSPEFKKYFNSEIEYDKVGYYELHFYNRAVNIDSSDKNTEAFNLIQEEIINIRNEVTLYPGSEKLNQYLYSTLPFIIRMNIHNTYPDIDRNGFDSLLLIRLVDMFSEKEMSKYIYDDFHRSLSSYNTEYYTSNKERIDKYLTDEDLSKKLITEYQALEAKLDAGYAPGLHKYDYGSEEFAGKEFKDILASYWGKVIYLDVWASWCGPCKAEMPFSKILKEKFKEKNVAFVYLSTDKNLEAWEKILKIMEMEGNHYRAGTDIRKYVLTEYEIKGIPRFMIFGKDGELVKLKASRPSSEEVVAELEALL